MEREVFKSKPLRGLPIGLIRGFMFGSLILLIGLVLGKQHRRYHWRRHRGSRGRSPPHHDP